ncbi:hypothetical protein GCM10027570_51840 [Streptomonospora sediminis]
MANDRAAPPPGTSWARPGSRRAGLWARRHQVADWLLLAAFLPWTGLMLVVGPGALIVLKLAAAGLAALGLIVPTALFAACGGLAVATVVSVAVLCRRTRPTLLLWAAAAALIGYGDFGLAALALFSYAAWFDNRRRLVLWTAVLSLCFVAVYTPFDGFSSGQAVFLLLMIYGLPLSVGLWIGTRRMLIANLRERAERLEREQHLLAEHAISAERTRIAREMHDVVAHRVSLMVLHAGGLEVSAPDERTSDSAALIRNTGRDALAELREILGVLRDAPEAGAPTAPQPELADLARLIGDWRAVGMPVDDSTGGTPAALSAQTERSAYRIVQEALTNAAKHAPGAKVRVHLEHRPDALEITVENDPPAAAPTNPPPGSGYGLAGLRERVTLAGGSLQTGPRLDGGWRVGAVLPAVPAGRGPAEAAP